MNKIAIYTVIILFMTCTTFASSEVEKLNQFAKHNEIALTYNPFKVKDFNTPMAGVQSNEVKQTRLKVVSIFNKKAYINDKWYKENDTMGEFKVIKIVASGVFIQNDGVVKFHPLNEKKNFINLKKGSDD